MFIMKFNRKTKGIVAGAALFSAVVPTQSMIAQAVSLKGIKQSFVSFFMRTFYFWFKNREALRKLEKVFYDRRSALIKSTEEEISKIKDDIIKNLEKLGYKKEGKLEFSTDGKLNVQDDVLNFLKSRNSKDDAIRQRYSNTQTYVAGFKCITYLESLLSEEDSVTLNKIKENKKIFKPLFESNLLPPFIEKIFEEKNIVLTELDENKKKEIEDSVHKIKDSMVKAIKRLGEKGDESIFSEDFFKNKEKELWKLNLEQGNEYDRIKIVTITAQYLVSFLPVYLKDIEKYRSNEFSNLDMNEEELYNLNEKIETLRKSKIYYTGTLDVFD